MKKIAILASGGNSPAMNNALITATKKAISLGIEPYVVYNGYRGLVNNEIQKADIRYIEQFYARGNIVINSARSLQFQNDISIQEQAANNLKKHGINDLIVIGGDGSFMGASRLIKQGINVFGLPGTIDNDVNSTQLTIGYISALENIVEAVDSIRNSFESHGGVCLVEVMGRHCPDLAVAAFIATNAEIIVTEDKILDAKQIAEAANECFKKGKRSVIVMIVENIYGKEVKTTLPELAKEIEPLIPEGYICRNNIIGYSQRGAYPIGYDRFVASLLANEAVQAIHENEKNLVFGFVNDKVERYPIETALKMSKPGKKVYIKDFEKLAKI